MGKRLNSLLLFSLCCGFLLATSCQQGAQGMDPAALKEEIRTSFEKRGMTVIDSMTAICDKRVAEATK